MLKQELQEVIGKLIAAGADRQEMEFWLGALDHMSEQEMQKLLENLKKVLPQ